MKNIVKFFKETFGQYFIIPLGILVVILYKQLSPIIRNFINKLQQDKALGDVKNTLDANNSDKVRVPHVNSVCDFLILQTKALNEDEEEMVTQCNTLANKEEVAYLCNLFSTKLGRNLKTYLLKALDSRYSPTGLFFKGHYSDLNQLVRTNLT